LGVDREFFYAKYRVLIVFWGKYDF
jgi:hypothetical protein